MHETAACVVSGHDSYSKIQTASFYHAVKQLLLILFFR